MALVTAFLPIDKHGSGGHMVPGDGRDKVRGRLQNQSDGAITSLFDSSYNGDTLDSRPKPLTWALFAKRDEAMTSMA